MTSEEQREKTTLEQPPVTEKPEKKAKKKPVNQVTIPLPTELLAQLNALAGLWGESRYATAKKLLTGQIQHHYSINRCRGRL